ncbi:hypothetical protein TIFTF001_022090 [Ficus carica]|uniref:Uncharacterized protein n=1 Tax=Ficus carica TaxID=3494 RepID=A0AA88AIN7_FICCA|nr:hypothetical protein TIFTF001_022090 [Ficus carica]
MVEIKNTYQVFPKKITPDNFNPFQKKKKKPSAPADPANTWAVIQPTGHGSDDQCELAGKAYCGWVAVAVAWWVAVDGVRVSTVFDGQKLRRDLGPEEIATVYKCYPHCLWRWGWVPAVGVTPVVFFISIGSLGLRRSTDAQRRSPGRLW